MCFFRSLANIETEGILFSAKGFPISRIRFDVGGQHNVVRVAQGPSPPYPLPPLRVNEEVHLILKCHPSLTRREREVREAVQFIYFCYSLLTI